MTTLNFGSFPGKCMFTCGYTYKEIYDSLKKQKLTAWLDAFKTCEYLFDGVTAGFASHRTLEIDGSIYYFHFLHLRDHFDYTDNAHSILSHEVIHLCTHNLKDILDIVKENEAFAYTHTYILKQCYEVLRGETVKCIKR